MRSESTGDENGSKNEPMREEKKISFPIVIGIYRLKKKKKKS